MHVPCHDCWKNDHGSKAFRVAFRSFNGNSDVIWVKYSQNQQQIEDHLWHYYNDVTVKWRKNRYCDVIDIKPISPTTYEKRVLFWSNSNSACVHMCAASLNVCWRVRTSANVRFFRGRPSEESPGFYRPVPIPVVPSLPGRDLGGSLPRMWARQLLQATDRRWMESWRSRILRTLIEESCKRYFGCSFWVYRYNNIKFVQ